MSVADTIEQLQAELHIHECERDLPRVKLWDKLFDTGSQVVANVIDGCVIEILARYPILNQLKYASGFLSQRVVR